MTKSFFALILLFCGLAYTTMAEDGHHGHGHDKFHGWYQNLYDDKGVSCCNDQDCRPTIHRVLPDDTVEVMVNGLWMKVPPQTILKKSAPDLGSHVCATSPLPWLPTKILCVVLGSGV